MSNRVVEIATAALGRALLKAGKTTEETPWSEIALAIIAALENAGYKVVGREPTEEMVERAAKAYFRSVAGRETTIGDYLRAALEAAHDAAPRYGEPSDHPESELPDWEDLRGKAPDCTGDMTSEAFVRKLRSEW